MAENNVTVNELERIWVDQERFNKLLRPNLPAAIEDRAEVIKDMVLHLTDEAHELLRVGVWKKHRNVKVRRNTAHAREEIVDCFKFLITLAQLYDMSVQDLVDGYWDKSAVVEMRYYSEWSEAKPEWPYAVIDIDGILCDYARGLATWLLNANVRGVRRASDGWPLAPDFLTTEQKQRLAHIEIHGGWLDAQTVGMELSQWEMLKRIFRLNGAKRTLPVYPDAHEFMAHVHGRYSVVLLTSRPIDAYPNMLTDTVAWLKMNHLCYDHIWWSMNKTDELISRNVLPHTAFAVDDDEQFITRYRQANIPVIQIDRTRTEPSYKPDGHWIAPDLVHARRVVDSFSKRKDRDR